jgi:hypothetical protein
MKVYWGAPEAMAAQANPFALLLGDSWFWYPLGNLAVAIGEEMPEHEFVVAGTNGANAGDWDTKLRSSTRLTFKMYAGSVRAFFLSGGGNEIAGEDDFLRILAEPEQCNKAPSVEECYEPGQPDGVLGRIAAAYRGVILQFRAYNKTATVFTHNYDNCWPTGKGFFGPGEWLKRPMEAAQVPDDLRRPLFADLLRRLGEVQKELAREPSLMPMVPIATAGTMPDEQRMWANELHPTAAGFRILARDAVVPALQGAMPATLAATAAATEAQPAPRKRAKRKKKKKR